MRVTKFEARPFEAPAFYSFPEPCPSIRIANMWKMDRWLESEETGKPFSHCQCCRFPLLEIAQPWLVNKEFVHGECVLEYAVCHPCRDAVAAEFSEESKRSVRDFLEREIDWDARLQQFMLAHDVGERFAACIACQAPRTELPGFGLSALFDSGGALTSGPLPLLICTSCIDRMTAGLSEASHHAWRKFLADHFDGPPDDSRFPGLL
jgi:hypothetical protein